MLRRRRSRDVALQMLYAQDTNPAHGRAQDMASFLDDFGTAESDDEPGDEQPFDRPLAERLVRGVSESQGELDEMLAKISRNWRPGRMARIDRSILRMALYELNFCPDIPIRVTINEAIELAKRFGADEAPAFVNGLLDSAVTVLGIRK